jgi:hypothetical protein
VSADGFDGPAGGRVGLSRRDAGLEQRRHRGSAPRGEWDRPFYGQPSARLQRWPHPSEVCSRYTSEPPIDIRSVRPRVLVGYWSPRPTTEKRTSVCRSETMPLTSNTSS